VTTVLWILQMLSIWVHIIWEKKIKDPKAIVEYEMQAAKLYIDWLQKVNLITSLHSLMFTWKNNGSTIYFVRPWDLSKEMTQ
jgi:hypothetical protein